MSQKQIDIVVFILSLIMWHFVFNWWDDYRKDYAKSEHYVVLGVDVAKDKMAYQSASGTVFLEDSCVNENNHSLERGVYRRKNGQFVCVINSTNHALVVEKGSNFVTVVTPEGNKKIITLASSVPVKAESGETNIHKCLSRQLLWRYTDKIEAGTLVELTSGWCEAKV